ncbi:TPA: hypothetical protein HI064_12900 [Escherichia coli]|nr:hypothetical protein [Escherichia coli]
MVPATIKTLPRVLFFTLSSVLTIFMSDICGAGYGITAASSNRRYIWCKYKCTIKSIQSCAGAKSS